MATRTAALRFIGAHLSQGLLEPAPDPDAVSAWEEGDLSGKLRLVQRKMRQALRDSRSLKFIFNASRRLGKSYLLCADAIETGLTEVNAPLRFAAPTQKQMKNILLPIFREITADCPSRIKPIWKAAEQKWIFPQNGSEMTIAGCNNGHEENLRGTAARKGYIDEAASIKNLKYVVNDIMMPQLLTTGGQLVIASTPPKTPVHDFVKMAAAARARPGEYMELPITEAGYPPEIVEKFIEEMGGRTSTACRRELFCEFIVDEGFAIIPEWKPEYERAQERDEYFQFFHKYEAMDIGVRDKTATLFGWYDFRRATLFVDDEVVIHGPKMTTDLLARAVKEKEKEVFGAHEVKLRIADNDNLILLNDLGSMHGLPFAATGKDTLEAMVNQVRMWVAAGRVIVHPRCKQLIGCLRYGVWDDKRKEFERYEEYGHFDALAALIYLVRNVDIYTNPVPPDFKLDKASMFVPPAGPGQEMKLIQQMFRPRFKR